MTHNRALLLSFSVPMAWGMSYPLMKIGAESMSATSVVALRCLIAFALTLFMFRNKVLHLSRALLGRAVVMGALMAVMLTCMCLGASLTTASAAGFLQSLTVVIVPILSCIMFRHKPEGKVVAGVVVVAAGMLLLSGADLAHLNLGAIVMLVSAFVYAAYIIVNKRFVEEVDSLSLGIWQLGFSGVFCALFSGVNGGLMLPQTPAQAASIVALALVCSAYGFVMQSVVQRHVTAETTGFAFSLEPVFSALFSFVLLGETLAPSGYAGAALIFAGVLVATLGLPRSRTSVRLPKDPVEPERLADSGQLVARI